MARGRKPVSDKLKVLRGTNQPTRMRGELIVDRIDKLPMPPRWIGKTAKKYYNTVGIFLLRANIITPVDVGVLEMCSYEFGKYHDLSEILEGIPLTGMDDDQAKDFRRIKTARNEAKETWIKLAIELGLTPAARLKFHVVKEEKSEFQKYLEEFGT